MLMFCLNFHFHFKGGVDSLFLILIQNKSKISKRCHFFWSTNNSLSHINYSSSGGCSLYGSQGRYRNPLLEHSQCICAVSFMGGYIVSVSQHNIGLYLMQRCKTFWELASLWLQAADPQEKTLLKHLEGNYNKWNYRWFVLKLIMCKIHPTRKVLVFFLPLQVVVFYSQLQMSQAGREVTSTMIILTKRHMKPVLSSINAPQST